MFDDQPTTGASVHKKGAPPEDIFEGLDDTPDVTAPSASPAPAPASASIAPPVSTDAPMPSVPAPKMEHRLAEDLPSPPPTNPPIIQKPLPPGLSDDDLSSAPPMIEQTMSSMEKPRRKSKGKMVMVIILVVLVVAVALLLTGLVMRSRKAVVIETTTPSVNDVRTPIEAVVNEVVTQKETVLKEDLLLGGDTTPVPPPEPVDSDRDGLSDEEELAKGTSPRSADTDVDGLSDRDEVEVWKSDPLNPDTDGDGYLDGDEVTNGYNPNGSGKLFEVPSTP